MKSYLTSAALLSLLLAAGCADRDDKAQDVDETKPPEATEPAPGAAETPAGRERAAAPRGERTEGARPTTGAPAPRPTAPREPAAPSEAPRATATAAAPGRRVAEWREVTIPAGTALPLELETAVSSETAKIETPVRARLRQAVVVNGVAALPAGAVVTGEVTAVERAGRVKGRSSLALNFNRVQADNLQGNLRTNPLTYIGEASKGEDATKIGAGAIGGAIIGGIVGGGEGAAKGAAIGGAAGTGVVLATRGKDVELASGTALAPTLSAPFTVRIAVR